MCVCVCVLCYLHANSCKIYTQFNFEKHKQRFVILNTFSKPFNIFPNRFVHCIHVPSINGFVCQLNSEVVISYEGTIISRMCVLRKTLPSVRARACGWILRSILYFTKHLSSSKCINSLKLTL